RGIQSRQARGRRMGRGRCVSHADLADGAPLRRNGETPRAAMFNRALVATCRGSGQSFTSRGYRITPCTIRPHGLPTLGSGLRVGTIRKESVMRRTLTLLISSLVLLVAMPVAAQDRIANVSLGGGVTWPMG